MSRDRYKIAEPDLPHFLTCTVVAWLSVFTRPQTVGFLLDSLRFLQEHNRLVLYGYVILENHLHMIVSSPDLSKEVGDFKSYTARRVIGYLQESGAHTLLQELEFWKLRHKVDSRYQLWQEGAHPKAIQGEEMLRQKLEYVHNNPLKRGYVDEPVHWRYSSARNYMGTPGLIPVRTEW